MDINDVKSIIAYNASSIPVLFEMCRIAKIAETVNNIVEGKSDNSKVSPGFLIEVLVVTIMHRRRFYGKLKNTGGNKNLNSCYRVTVLQWNNYTIMHLLVFSCKIKFPRIATKNFQLFCQAG